MHAIFSFVGNYNDKKNKFDWLRAIKKLHVEVYNHLDDNPDKIIAYRLFDFLIVHYKTFGLIGEHDILH